MKKSILRAASLFLSIALTATFGFLTYFIIASSLEKGNSIESPLPEEDNIHDNGGDSEDSFRLSASFTGHIR